MIGFHVINAEWTSGFQEVDSYGLCLDRVEAQNSLVPDRGGGFSRVHGFPLIPDFCLDGERFYPLAQRDIFLDEQAVDSLRFFKSKGQGGGSDVVPGCPVGIVIGINNSVGGKVVAPRVGRHGMGSGEQVVA